jgi:hypothetical protein
MIVLATVAAVYLLMVRYDYLLSDYDAEQRKTNWDYCQCSGSFRDVMAWWWFR